MQLPQLHAGCSYARGQLLGADTSLAYENVLESPPPSQTTLPACLHTLYSLFSPQLPRCNEFSSVADFQPSKRCRSITCYALVPLPLNTACVMRRGEATGLRNNRTWHRSAG